MKSWFRKPCMTKFYMIRVQSERNNSKVLCNRGGVHSFQVQDQALVEKLSGRLHRGELEVIIGAVEQGISTVILDDRQARMLAKTFKLDCTGTLGVLLTAKAKHLIPEVKKYLDGLSDQGFR